MVFDNHRINEDDDDENAEELLVCIIQDPVDVQTCLEYTYENPRRHSFFSRVKAVNIEATSDTFLDQNHREDIIKLMGWIRLLPNLQELGLSLSSSVICLEALSEIVQHHTPKLTYLALFGPYTTHNEASWMRCAGDLSMLSNVLATHRTLKRLDLQNFDLWTGGHDYCTFVDTIMSLRKLTVLHLTFDVYDDEENNEFASLYRETVLSLFIRKIHTSHLKVLNLVGRPLECDGDSAIIALSEAVQTNQTIEKLSLRSSAFGPPVYLHTAGIQAFARVLLQPSTTLIDLSLAVNHEHSVAPHLCDALTSNQTLQRLELRWINAPRPTPPNPPLPPRHDADALLQVLEQHNYTLRDVRLLAKDTLVTVPGSPQDLASFWCALNDKGRRKQLLLRDNNNTVTTRNDWIGVLADCCDSVRMSFYWLSNNPELCSVA